MTSSSSNKDVPSGPPTQPESGADSGEQLGEPSTATDEAQVEEPDALAQADLEMWLRHFGAC